MVVIGLCSYVMRKAGFDLAPLVIAFVLAEPIEYTLSQSLLYAYGSPFHYLFVDRPIASFFLVSALIWIAWLTARGGAEFGNVSVAHTVLMLLSGVATAVPLLLFAGAANRVPLVGLGIMQYVAPIIQLAVGVLIYHEPMPPARLAGFTLVWAALIIFTVDGIRSARKARIARAVADPAAATAEPATALPPR